MAMIDTVLSGSFTSDGSDKILEIPSDVDCIEVLNYTQMATQQATGRGVEFKWYRGFSDGYGYMLSKEDAADTTTSEIITSGGFELVNNTEQSLGSANSTITAVSTAATPVVSLTSTSGLSDGDVVRLFNVSGAQQLGGIDFTIGSVVSNTSFTLAYMAQLGAAGTTGSLRKVNYDPYFYPRQRYISAISQASSAVITMTVAHGYNVGDIVRLNVPAAYGMSEINGLLGEVSATSASTITVDIDSSAFTAFAFPATAAVPFSPATVVPAGQAPSLDLNGSADSAYDNQGYIGIKLYAGSDSPAGSNGDVIYWKAQKSFQVYSS